MGAEVLHPPCGELPRPGSAVKDDQLRLCNSDPQTRLLLKYLNIGFHCDEDSCYSIPGYDNKLRGF
jgi:hypothetical protein